MEALRLGRIKVIGYSEPVGVDLQVWKRPLSVGRWSRRDMKTHAWLGGARA